MSTSGTDSHGHWTSQVILCSTKMDTSTKDLADPVLLSKIDKFFELGIGEYVALPQVKHSVSSLFHARYSS